MRKKLRLAGLVLTLGAVGLLVLAVVGSAGAVSGSWTTLAPAPSAEYAGSGAAAGGKLYVAAGYPDGTPLQEYDPAADTWTVRPGPALARREPSLAAIGTKLYLTGGCTGGDCANVTASLEIYDTATNTWSSGPAMPRARRCATSAELDGKLYVVAGRAAGSSGGLGDNDVYDPVTNSWSTRAPLPAGNQPCSANAVGYDHKLYVVGGQYWGSFDYPGKLWVYDPATDGWSAGATMPAGTGRGQSFVGVIDGLLHVAGGADNAVRSDHYVYDFATDSWSSAAPLPAPRFFGGGAAIGDTLYAALGSNGSDLLNTIVAWTASEPPTPSDTTAPVASPGQSPPANGDGWNNTDVTVSWNWADEAGGSGIDASSCTTSTTSSGEGSLLLSASCRDNAGNTGNASYTVAVDTTAPTVTYGGNAGTYTVAQQVVITCAAADQVGLSGLLSTTCADVDAPAWSFPLGPNSLSAGATDRAGNVGTGSTSFTVTVGFDSLCDLAGQFSSDAGVTQGLCAKLAAAGDAAARGQAKTKSTIVNAFRNQVGAQTGKALTASQAATLKRLASAL